MLRWVKYLILLEGLVSADASAQTRLLSGATTSFASRGTVTMGVDTPLTSYPFLNYLKGAYQCYTSVPSELTAKQYPISTLTTEYGCQAQIPSAVGTAQMVTSFTGQGAIQIPVNVNTLTVTSVSAGCTFTGSNVRLSGTDCRAVYSFNSGPPTTSFTVTLPAGVTYSNMGNAVIARLADEGRLTAGQTFNNDFIQRYQALNPGRIRFLSWNGVNDNNNFTNFAYRAPVDSFAYSNRYEPATIVAGGTISGTDTYTAAAYPDMPVAWTDKETFFGTVTNTNATTTPTINVGGRGAKVILDTYAFPVTAGYIPANSQVQFVYDATLDKVMAFIGSPNNFNGGITAYVPFEVMISLCNTLRTGCWINIPDLYTDASVISLATLLRDNLAVSLSAFLELSNELWNNSASFNQHWYALNAGTTLGFPGTWISWQGLRHRQMMGLATSAWAPRSLSTLKRVMASSLNAVDTDFFINQQSHGSELGAYGYNIAPNRPIDYSDAIAVANYYDGTQTKNFFGGWPVYDTWSSGTTYAANALVTYNSLAYQSTGAGNINHQPDVSPANWTSVPAAGAGLLTASDQCAAADYTNCFTFFNGDIRGTLAQNGVIGQQTMADNLARYPVWNTIAGTVGAAPLPLYAYEGTYEFWYPTVAQLVTAGFSGPNSTLYGGPSGRIASAVNLFKFSGTFKTMVIDANTQWFSQSRVVAGAQLVLTGPNQWAIYSGDLYSIPYTSYQAVQTIDTP